MKSNFDFSDLDRKGIFIKPNETQLEYLLRVTSLEDFFFLNKKLLKDSISSEEWGEAKRCLENVYNLAPDWMLAYYSDKDLPWWQGAATWIEENGSTIQLKTPFRKGWYLSSKRDDVLAHEAIHVARAPLNQDKFEELFAYRVSKNRFIRTLGPLFEQSWESYLFVVSLFISPLILGISVFKDWYFFYLFANLLPWSILTYLCLKLARRRRVLSKCITHLKKLVEGKANSLALRLLDKEIILFSKLTSDQIKEYILQKSKDDFRWNVLSQIYLKND